jgi:hypothetical protein
MIDLVSLILSIIICFFISFKYIKKYHFKIITMLIINLIAIFFTTAIISFIFIFIKMLFFY